LAASRQRSLSAEVIELLRQALADELLRQEQPALLEAIRRRRYHAPADMDSTKLLREDHAR
jgi:hypothetical protein